MSNRAWMKLAVTSAALAALACNGGGGGGPTCDLAVKAPAGAYQIELQPLAGTSLTPEQQTAFDDAVARIESIVTGQLSTVAVNRTCDMGPYGSEPVNQSISGLLILVKVEALSDPNVLAVSGPCLIRSSSHLPLVGVMIFNSQNLDGLSTLDLHKTVLHEMLHTLGFGTMWGPPTSGSFSFDLLSGAGHAGTSYTGFQALCGAKAHNSAPSSWNKVPVEDCSGPNPGGCGEGTRDSHWRFNAFGPATASELMTGWITRNADQPLSATTVASLHDLGYEVDVTKADDYTITPVTMAAARSLSQVGQGIPLRDDLLHVQPLEVDEP